MKNIIVFLVISFCLTLVQAINHNSSIDANDNVKANINTKYFTQANLDGMTNSDLMLSSDEEENFQTELSNGRVVTIRVLPQTASLRAQGILNTSCIENNCTLELKEVGFGDDQRIVYEIETEKDARILGLFRTKSEVRIQIDAETGEIVEVDKPWWAVIDDMNNISDNISAAHLADSFISRNSNSTEPSH